MTLEQLIALFRIRTDDSAEPPLWEDDEITDYLNEAIDEACTRSPLLVDSTTEAVVSITMTAGENTYPLHSSVVAIRRAKLDSQERPISVMSTDKLDADFPGWEDTSSEPFAVAMSGTHELIIAGVVAANDVLRLIVQRTPLNHLVEYADNTEISDRNARDALYLAMALAYKKPDGETFDIERAKMYEDKFTSVFGAPIGATGATPDSLWPRPLAAGI